MLVVAAMTLGLVAAAGGSDPNALLISAFKSRQAINRGSMSIAVSSRTDRGDESSRKYKVWFDRQRLRIDRMPSSADSPFKPVTLCKNCEKPGYCFIWDQAISTTGQALTPQFQSNRSNDSANMLFDVRLIGLMPTYVDLLYPYNLEALIGSTERVDLSVHNAMLDDAQVAVVSFVYRSGSRPRMQYWICPAKGHAVLKAHCRNEFPDGVFEEQIECRYKQYKTTTIWFPEECVYTRKESGKEIGGERLKISDLSLNEVLPESVFTLANIGLPEGTHIHSRDEGAKAYVFTKGRLDHVSHRGMFLPQPNSVSEADSRGLWLQLACVGFALVLVTSMILYRRAQSGFKPGG